jgi:hypothetical protein
MQGNEEKLKVVVMRERRHCWHRKLKMWESDLLGEGVLISHEAIHNHHPFLPILNTDLSKKQRHHHTSRHYPNSPIHTMLDVKPSEVDLNRVFRFDKIRFSGFRTVLLPVSGELRTSMMRIA